MTCSKPGGAVVAAPRRPCAVLAASIQGDGASVPSEVYFIAACLGGAKPGGHIFAAVGVDGFHLSNFPVVFHFFFP